MKTVASLVLLFGSGTAALEDNIYQHDDVGVANGRKFWYPEWRMRQLLEEVHDQRSLEQKIEVDRDTEFYLTDEEIDEVLHPKLDSNWSLERRIEKVLGMRTYDDLGDFDEMEDDEEEEELQEEAPLQKGQQRKLPRKNGNLFKREGGNRRNKRGGGRNNTNKTGKRGGRNNNGGGRNNANNNLDGRNNANKTSKRGGRNNNKKRGKRGNKKRGKRGKRGGNQHQVFKYTNKQYKNICLDPPDRYRTCFSREVDPTNDHVGCDAILRNSYNIGAQFLQKGYWPPPDNDPTIIDPTVPYQEPYLEDDEMLTEGFMHITLLQATEPLDCDARIRVEETILTYLQHNVGDDDTFQPVCVFVAEEAVDEELVRDADGRIAATTAMRVEIAYRTKQRFNDKIQEDRRRMMEVSSTLTERNLLALCDTANHHLCCSQDSINADPGAFCRNIGCNYSDCRRRGTLDVGSSGRPGSSNVGSTSGRPGSGSRPGSQPLRPPANQLKRPVRPNIRRTQVDDATTNAEKKLNGSINSERMTRRQNPNRCQNTRYKGKSLEQVLKQDTVFKNVEMALSLLNDTDTSAVAECSVNWYIVKNKGIPTKTCDDYNERDCMNNEDLEYAEEDVRCLQPSATPSQMPSESAIPSSSPSYNSTYSPTMFPTTDESASSTMIPTLIPTASNATYDDDDDAAGDDDGDAF